MHIMLHISNQISYHVGMVVPNTAARGIASVVDMCDGQDLGLGDAVNNFHLTKNLFFRMKNGLGFWALSPFFILWILVCFTTVSNE